MPLLKKINFIVVSLLTAIQAFTQTELEMKTNADDLFSKKRYTEATPLYLRLLSLQPKSFEYSYKYGTCILYNSTNKQDAIRYLSYAVKSQQPIAEATYYLGKAYHLNYQFNDAITQYKSYISQVGVKGPFYAEAQRNIAMCENGKNLLVNLTDVIVRKKTEIKQSDFFRLYDLKEIGGSIIIAIDFQSKVDKKLNHTPIVHLAPNQENVYFSSYGDGNNLDIYIARRLPGGKFGVPQKLPGSVNTNFDEDYPYLHPNGNELYFSSKGHNSMGGYDIFKAKRNQENNQFEDVTNVDFSISSPDDDILYVVDKDNKNAFFSSTRQARDGKIAVYKVAVERIPIQLAIVKGAFTSTILSTNPKMSVEVVDKTNGRKIGTFKNLKDESYLITFPKGGKYQYKVKIDGRDEVFLADVEIPFLKEMRPLKQRMVHERSNDKEMVRIVNLFDEQVEDAHAIIAQVLKERANLEVNEEHYSESENDQEKELNKLLAEIGLANRMPQEVAQMLDQTDKLITNASNAGSLLEQKANAVAKQLYEEIAEIDNEVRDLVKEADASHSQNRKEIILSNAVELYKQREIKLNQIQQTLTEAQQMSGKTATVEPAKIVAFNKFSSAFTQAVNENNANAQVSLLQENKELIQTVLSNNSPISISTELHKKQETFDSEIARLKTIEQGYQEEKFRVENDIATLQQQLDGAKEKQKPEIQNRIEEKKYALSELLSNIKKTEGNIASNELKRAENNQRLVLVNTIEHHTGKLVSTAELNQAKALIAESKAQTLKAYVETSLTKLKESKNIAQSENVAEKAMENYNAASEKIVMDNQLSAYEKQHQLLELNEKNRAELTENINQINASNSLDEETRTQEITVLQKQLKALELDQELFKQAQRAAAKEEITKLKVENIIDAIAPSYVANKQALQSNQQLSEIQKLEQQNELDRELIRAIETEIKRIQAEKVHEKSVNQAKIDVLTKQNNSTQVAITTRTSQIDALEKDFLAKQNAVESEVKLSALTSEIASSFTSVMENLNASPIAERINNLSNLAETLKEKKTSVEQLKSKFPTIDIEPIKMDIESKLAEVSMLQENCQKSIDQERELVAQKQAEEAEKQKASNIAQEQAKQEAIAQKEQELVAQKQAEEAEKQKAAVIAQEQAKQEAIAQKERELVAQKQAEEAEKQKATEIAQEQAKQEAIAQKERELVAQKQAEEAEKQKATEIAQEQAKQEAIAQKERELVAQKQAEEAEKQKATEIAQEQAKQEAIAQKERELVAQKQAEEAEKQQAVQLQSESTLVVNSPVSEKVQLQKRLDQKDLSSKERAEILKQLAVISQKETSEQIARKSEQTAVLDKKLEAISSSIPSEIQALDKRISSEKVAAKKVELLQQKIEQQTEVIQLIERQLVLNENEQIHSNQPNARLYSQDELIQKRRLAIIEIEELTQWRQATETEFEQAKKPEKAGIQTKIKQIDDRISLAQEEVQFYDRQLKLYQKFDNSPTLSSNTPSISFNEERQLAAEESYETYAKLIATKNSLLFNHAQATKELAKQQQALEKERMMATTTASRKESLLQEIEKKSITLKEIEQKIQAVDTEIKAALPEESSQRMKFENLAARGINPIKKAFVASALIPISITGIEFNPTPSTLPELKKIPIEVKAPEGLIYRVQVGAFAKPIPEQHFKEFSPVTGEKIANTNITRYMAGYFNAAQNVVEARDKIRKIGYDDAFVVAYCDGKRISFAEARQLEARGECIAQQAEKIQLEVSNNIAKQVGLDDTTKVIKPVSEYSYNQAKGAAKAVAIEQFDPNQICFTIQIGVFNKPVPPERLFHLDPLYTIRIENGQIRYSVGLFGELAPASTQLSHVKEKVKDAFIVAYYQGKRITVAQARKLISEGVPVYSPEKSTISKPHNSDQQLASTREIEVFVGESEVITKQTQPTHYIQFSSKHSYDEYPTEELRRYGAKGDFYYDINDKRIKSTIYASDQVLPRISAFSSEMDTIKHTVNEVHEMEKSATVVKLTSATIPGDLAYWLTFFPYRKTYNLTESGLEIRIFDLQNSALSALKEVANSIGVNVLESTTKGEEEDE